MSEGIVLDENDVPVLQKDHDRFAPPAWSGAWERPELQTAPGPVPGRPDRATQILHVIARWRVAVDRGLGADADDLTRALEEAGFYLSDLET